MELRGFGENREGGVERDGQGWGQEGIISS